MALLFGASRWLLSATALACVWIAPIGAQVQQNLQLNRAEVLAEQNQRIRIGGENLTLQQNFTATPLLAAEPQPRGIIVQFDAPLTAERRTELEAAGTTVEEFLGGTTYLMTVPPTSPATSPLNANTTFGAVLSPAAKIQPSVNEPLPAVPSDLQSDSEQFQPGLTVNFFSSQADEAARAVLENNGFTVLEQLSPSSFVVSGDATVAEQLANIPSVKAVEQGPVPFLPLNATGRRNANTDLAQLFSLSTAAPTYRGFTGAGVRIAIADSGVDGNHDDFDTVDSNGAAGTSRVYNSRPGSKRHGTHVASIAGGSGLNSDANGHPDFSMRGHAPEALIGDYASMGSSYANHHAAINDDDTDISNHSYVQSTNGYGSAAARIDEIVRGDAVHAGETIAPRPQVWAAGNNGTGSQYDNEEGYYSVFTSAKNTISVGSIDSLDNRISNFSSLGPTFDGRIKPDVVAPGCIDSISAPSRGIQAASNSTQGYTGSCGTSMAAPAVSGIIGLMMEARQNTSSSTTSLFPSTYKALLVQTASDMIKPHAFADREFDNPDTSSPVIYHAGPDFATGFGMVDAAAAVTAISDSSRWRQAIAGNTGEVDTFCMDVPNGSGELRVALAWDDEPGSVVTSSTTAKLVNDLDLELVSPFGTVFRPWTLNPLPFTGSPGAGGLDPIAQSDVVPARRDVDRLNNVEMASVPLPIAGRWKIRVRAFNLPNANAQPYAIASSQRVNQFCGVVVPICKRFPWICSTYDPIDDPIFPVDWRRPVPVDDICRYVINCPGCGAIRSDRFCPNWQMRFDNIPRDARITVFDDNGEIRSRLKPGETTVDIEQRKVGTEQFIAITNPNGKPYDHPLKPNIKALE